MKKMKKTISKRVLLLFMGINFICISCNGKLKYKNIDSFKLYLNEIGLQNSKENKIYYVVRVEDCFSCNTTESNLSMLLNIKKNKNIQIIIVGKTLRNDLSKLIRNLSKRNEVFIDDKSEIFNFETGFSKPILVHLNIDGDVVYFQEVTDEKVKKVKKYLSEQTNI